MQDQKPPLPAISTDRDAILKTRRQLEQERRPAGRDGDQGALETGPEDAADAAMDRAFIPRPGGT